MNKTYGVMFLGLYYWFKLLVYGLGLYYWFMTTIHFMASSVMSNFHRVMGDGFSKMVNSILKTEEKFSHCGCHLRYFSLVAGSGRRVDYFFVGNKLKRLPFKRSVLSKRNLKEKINKFFEAAT